MASSLSVCVCRRLLPQSPKAFSCRAGAFPRRFSFLNTPTSSNQTTVPRRGHWLSPSVPGFSGCKRLSVSSASPLSSYTRGHRLNRHPSTTTITASSSSCPLFPSFSSSRTFSSSIAPANPAALADPLRAFPPASGVFAGGGVASSASSSSSSPTTAFYSEDVLTELGRDDIKAVRSMEEYEDLVYGHPDKVLVCLFSARFSLQGRLLVQPFLDLAVVSSSSSAASTSSTVFLLIDCDEVPRAAYHARVENVPSIVVMKKAGALRHLITDKVGGEKSAADMIQETRAAVEQAQRAEQKDGENSPYASYTHNIGIDNLNVYRVQWPVA